MSAVTILAQAALFSYKVSSGHSCTHTDKYCCEEDTGLQKVAFWFSVPSSKLERTEFLQHAAAGLSGGLPEGQLLFCLTQISGEKLRAEQVQQTQGKILWVEKQCPLSRSWGENLRQALPRVTRWLERWLSG